MRGPDEWSSVYAAWVMRVVVLAWCWSTNSVAVAVGGVGTVGVVVDAPVLDQDLGFEQVSNCYRLGSSSRIRPLNVSVGAFSQGEPGSFNTVCSGVLAR